MSDPITGGFTISRTGVSDRLYTTQRVSDLVSRLLVLYLCSHRRREYHGSLGGHYKNEK